MFAHTVVVLRRMLKKEENVKENKKCQLRVIAKIAVVLRKFQKFESEKHKNSIEYTFDKLQAIEELKALSLKDRVFYLKQPEKLVYFVRKFGLNFDDISSVSDDMLPQIMRGLHEDEWDEKTKRLLACTLKYSARSSTNGAGVVKSSSVISLVKESNSVAVMTELVWTLGYLIDPSNEAVDFVAYEEIINSVDLDESARLFLASRVEVSKNINSRQQIEHRYKTAKQVKSNKGKKNQLVVTKTIQTVKSTGKSRKSEEEDLNILNLANALRNRNRKVNIKSTIEDVETLDETQGDDRSILRTTWAECVNLYQFACQGQAIKSDDKDNYLPKRFFGEQFFFDWNIGNSRKIYGFFINRMIAATFMKISKKQELSDNAIDKLMTCVVDFKTLVAKLTDNCESIVDFFVNGMFDQYSQLIALKEPDLVTSFAHSILNKTMKADVNLGYIWNSINKTYIDYEQTEIEVLIKKEIKQLRLDSVNALYNSALRNKSVLTKDRIELIQTCLAKDDDEDDEKFKSLLYRLIELVMTSSDLDYKRLFNAYMRKLQFKSTNNIKFAVRFLIDQSRDIRRCEELFNAETIEQLVQILKYQVYDDRIKCQVVEVVNNYLGHETSDGLTQSQMTLLIETVVESSTELTSGVFKAILLTAEKNRSLHDAVKTKLIQSIESNHSNFVILILSRLEDHIRDTHDLERLSQKLDSDSVVVEQELEIKFEKSSDSNRDCTSIARLTCKLLLSSIEKGALVSENTVENLMMAVGSCDKQTKINAAKCIHKLSKYSAFDNDMINAMQGHVGHEVYDVSVYMHSAYCKSLARLAARSSLKPIDAMHLESLGSLLLHESLKIGDQDFADEINRNILSTLKFEARKQMFEEENLFTMIEEIIFLNEKYSVQAVEILEEYTSKYKIPVSSIAALEHALGLSDLYEKSMFSLENAIRNGQSVSHKTMQIFADYLYASTNTRRRYNCFKILDKVSINQDLPDDIFVKLELEKAAFGLERVKEKKCIVDFIRDATEKGIQLPIDTMNALAGEIESEDVLSILLNITGSRQILNEDFINKLTARFQPKSAGNAVLVGIFENVAKNNQTLPNELLKKLEEASENERIKEQVMTIFLYMGQKGEKLSHNIIGKILEKCEREQDSVLKQDYLSTLASIIQTTDHIQSFIGRLQSILVDGVVCENTNIQKICIGALKALMSRADINEEVLNKLVAVGTGINCDEFMRENIYLLLSERTMSLNLKVKMELANLKCGSNQELLGKLRYHISNESGLLEQNYNQLRAIIDEDSSLQEDAIRMLLSSKGKKEMTEDLIESVAVLSESGSSKEIKDACMKLLEDAEKSGASLTQKAKILLNEKSEKEKTEQYMRQFSSSSLYNTLSKAFQLNDSQIQDLLRLLKVNKRFLEIEDLEELLDIAFESNLVYYENSAFVYLIEQILLANQLKDKALGFYKRIIKEGKFQKVEVVLEMLVEYFNKKKIEAQQEKERFQKALLEKKNSNVLPGLKLPLVDDFYSEINALPLLIECIYHAIVRNCELVNSCFSLLENNLDNETEHVRSLSFKALRLAACNGQVKSEVFKSWCESTLENLSTNAGVNISQKVNCLDLLEVIISLRHIDIDLFKSADELLVRELVVSNLFAEFRPNDNERMEFYSNWLLIEERFGYDRSLKILDRMLQKMSSFGSLNEINNILLFAKDSDYDEVLRNLDEEWTPCTSFKVKWCFKKMQDRLINRNIDTEYLWKLAENASQRLEAGFLDKLFQCVSVIGNLRSFESLVSFCCSGQIKIDDLCFENVRVEDLKRLLEVKCICNSLQSKTQIDTTELFGILFNLLQKKWTFDQLGQLIEAITNLKPNKPVKNSIDLLSIVSQYKLSSANHQKFLDILASKSFDSSLKALSQLVIENNFQSKGKVKNPIELLIELERLNANDALLVDFIHSTLANELQNVKSESLKSRIYDTQTVICEWNEKQIHFWSLEAKTKAFSKIEALAVIKRANYLFSGFHLTDIQILCSLIALNSEAADMKGKLMQVATGEGKSTIVCILAIINGLKGKVNVITSSPVLAERDAKEKMKLYRMFGLTCNNNNDNAVYLRGPKDCYKADVVYGEVSQFQFDQLRDEYSKLGTLASRQCTVAIIDEVDSMLIDDSSKIARLSSTVAGMDHFQSIYCFLWQKLLSIKEKFIVFNNKQYLLNGKLRFEDGKTIIRSVNEQGEMQEVDLEASKEDISRFGKLIETDIDEFLRTSLEEYIDSLRENKVIHVPGNFEEFFKKQKPKWIHNAIEALNYQENVHYVVQDGQIKPVDYFSTGIVQSATNWSDGLHQFLQMKHNLKMTCETFTTNFLSNIGYIKAYGKIYGLTGTLGSEKAREVLRSVYEVDLVNVPQQHQKQYLELPTMVKSNEAEWLQAITVAAQLEARKDRGILIICETIDHAQVIAERLKAANHRSSAIKLYTMNNMNQEKHVEKVLPGEVIIATNLAGRGTDIRTDGIEEHGGLHVILTFMPNNQRVEDQAYGRTARQGKRGTGQMILNFMSLIGYNDVNPEKVKAKRDEIESNSLDEFQNNELKLIVIKDKLFKRFCTFLNDEIRQSIREKSCGIWQTAKSVFIDVTPSVLESNILAAVEEQWAMFLHKIDEQTIPVEEAEGEYKKLIEKLRQDYETDEIIKNCYYHVVIGMDYIVNHSDPQNAVKCFEKAIKKSDERFSGAALVGLGWGSILIREKGYKIKARDSFAKALDILTNEMSYLNSMQMILREIQPGFTNSALDRQLTIKASILGSYLNSVQNCVQVIKKSMRLIDMVKIERNLDKKNVKEKLESFFEIEDNKLEKACVKERIGMCSELERNEEKEVEVEWDKKAEYELVFNDLTRREDSITIDQASLTINEGFKNKALGSSYDKLRLRLKQVPLDRLKVLFNPNKVYEELTDETAIVKLKGDRSVAAFCRLSSSHAVDLKIVCDNGKPEMLNNRQINELIGIIEKRKDPRARYSVTVKQANVNAINEYFKDDWQKSATLSISFDSLKYENAYAKLTEIHAKSVDIEMVVTKSALLPVVEKGELFSAKVCVAERKTYETVEGDELVKRIEALESDDSPFYLQINNLLCDEAKQLIKYFQGSSFNVTFAGLRFYESLKGLGDNPVAFCFENLNKTTAEDFIEVLRKEQLEFSLEFRKLDHKQAKSIIQSARLEQEHIETGKKIKTLSELYMKSDMPTLELAEFAAKGIEYLLEMNEQRSIPWRSVIAVAILGTMQVAIGGVLIATGFGATVGMGLITEGLADIFTAYRAFSNRQFTWTDYCKQKAVSLVISAVSCGYGKLKDAYKGASTLTSGISIEALEQTGTQFITNGRSVAQHVAKTGTNLKSLAFKYTGVKAGEAVVREGLNTGLQCLSRLSLDSFRSQICESIQLRVKSKFCKPELSLLLRKLFALDALAKSKALQGRVDRIVIETLSPERNFLRKQFDTIGLPLMKGILADEKFFGSAFSMGLRIAGTLQGLYEIQAIVDNIYAELVKKLTQTDKNMMTMTLVLHQHLKIDKDTARSIADQLRVDGVIDENDNLSISFDDEDCNELRKRVDQFSRNSENAMVAKFMNSYCDEFTKINLDSFGLIIKSVSDKITEQVIRVIESQLISPWSTLAVSSATASLSARIQDYCLVDKEQNSDSQNKDQKKYDDLQKKKENNEQLSQKERQFLKSYGKYRTFGEQINYNARDYCQAYEQQEIQYFSASSTGTPHKVSEEVKELAEEVRDGKTATMGEIVTAASKNGVKLKVVDNRNYQRTQQDIDNGVKIVFIEKGEQDWMNVDMDGHAYYMDKDGNFVEVETGPTDCFYGVLSKILEERGVNKSIADLRNETADAILTNANYFKVIEAEKWLMERYPCEAKTLIFSAGARKSDEPLTNEQKAVLLIMLFLIYLMEDLPGGPYHKLSKLTEGQKGGALELNHNPPKSCYVGTRYEGISSSSMPCIIMPYDLHRKIPSTVSQRYREEGREMLRQGRFDEMFMLELNCMLQVTNDPYIQRVFIEGAIRSIEHYRDNTVRNHRTAQDVRLFNNPNSLLDQCDRLIQQRNLPTIDQVKEHYNNSIEYNEDDFSNRNSTQRFNN